jgi:hypothetical protein
MAPATDAIRRSIAQAIAKSDARRSTQLTSRNRSVTAHETGLPCRAAAPLRAPPALGERFAADIVADHIPAEAAAAQRASPERPRRTTSVPPEAPGR